MKWLLLLISLSVFGQMEIRPNVNPDASELKYRYKNDSLTVWSDYPIRSVSVRSGVERRLANTNSRKLKLDVSWINEERCFVIVVTNRKIITFNIDLE